MIPQEVYRMYNILKSFLGDSKSGLDESYQLQFPCPKCIQEKGEDEEHKFNLEVSLSKNLYNCWSCSASGDKMHGTIFNLIRKYGNEGLLSDYKRALSDLRENKLYLLSFKSDEFSILNDEDALYEGLTLPKGYRTFKPGQREDDEALAYLAKRGITQSIIDKFKIGFIPYDKDDRFMCKRIILPSFDSRGFLNYWTGRDYVDWKWRPKYKNPDVNRKDIIFNESNIDWDADITLVEGPFDCLVFPNSIPLLGKKLGNDFKLYHDLFTRANANINIFLDGDAYPAAKELYKQLNTGSLIDRIRYVPVEKDLDPSQIFQEQGKKGIIEHMSRSTKLKEIYLLN
jgi:DNA primase